MRNRKQLIVALLGGACSLAMLAPQAEAQRTSRTQRQQQRQAQQQQQQEEGRTAASGTLQLPPGQPIIVLSVQSPNEARVGQSFDYQIRVQNNSQNIVVHDLVIAQHAGDGFEIESSELQGEPAGGRDAKVERNQPADEQRQSAEDRQQKTEKRQADNQDEQESKREEQKDKQGRSESKDSDNDDSNSDEPKSNDAKDDDSDSDQSAKDESTRDAAKGDPSQNETSRARHAQSDSAASSSKSDMVDGSRWKIDRLMPGESRTILVTASSDSEGAGNVCVAVESYVPALCLTTRFTKPELEIVKQAPETANICDEIKFEYLVKNTGTGDLQRFTVRDELPDGLQTVDGREELEFTLDDGLKAGGVRKFEARLRASDTGEFTSRATVEGSGGVEARSNRAGTKVQKAELAVSIDGPQAQAVGVLASYTVRVTNEGDAPAPGTQLRLYFPRSADIVRASQPRKSASPVGQRASEGSRSAARVASHEHGLQTEAQAETARGEPRDQAESTEASAREEQQRKEQQREDREQEEQQRKDQQREEQEQKDQPEADQQPKSEDAADEQRSTKSSDRATAQVRSEDRRDQARRVQSRENQERQNMAQNHWQLGTLAPGETVEVTYVLRPYEDGQLEQVAVAEYACATAQDREMLLAESTTATEILKLTGLRLTVIDDHDPVAKGQNVIYTVAVLNQGNAPAENIEINVKLPEEVKFVEAKGATTGEHSENEVSFKPVPTLESGKQVVWQIVASVDEEVGEKTQSSIEVELNSDDLDESITAQEPTTFFEAEKRTARAEEADEEASEKK